MAEETQKEVKAVEPAMTTLERIQSLANFANGVQDEGVKKAILALPCGERLYDIFVSAVSKEIEDMMNPSKAAPKEMMDAVSAAKGLKDMLGHLYGVVAELNRAQLLAVLNMLNQNLGGRAIPQAPQQQDAQQQQIQQEQQSSDPRAGRSNGTGLSW